MRRVVPLVALLAAPLGALAATPAYAAQAKRSPTVRLVSPMRATVGKTITVRGAGFSSSRRRNTIVFRAPSRRTAFAKPRRASARKLVVRVPGSVERLLRNPDGKGVGHPTRFRIRVLIGRRYGKLSARRNSPVIVSALRSGAPASCGKGSDFDNDLISNSLEAQIKTDPCSADTDGDSVEDGFEQESARDLNQRALPYPGKRPFANALDPSDAGYDYDGDGLSLLEEFRAWAHAPASPPPSGLQLYTGDLAAPAFGGPYGARPTFGGHTLPLNYSDGEQASIDGGPTDDERDVDGDGLRNIDEIRALMWQPHYPAGKDCGYEYRPVLPRTFQDTDYLNWDSDGDGVWDGNDDQDTDGVSNVDEVQPPFLVPPDPRYDDCDEISPLPADGAQNGSLTLRHPFNPCLPYRSETCARYGQRD